LLKIIISFLLDDYYYILLRKVYPFNFKESNPNLYIVYSILLDLNELNKSRHVFFTGHTWSKVVKI